MNVCAKCATSKEFVDIVMYDKKDLLFDGQCDLCGKNAVVFKREVK